MSYYKAAFKKYAAFTGRARRKEYWMFFLFNMIFAIVASIIDRILHTTYYRNYYGLFYTLYGLAVIIPSLAITVRRLHDINKAGTWIFISLIPIVGGIWLLILMCTEGTRGPNRFGDDPKDIVYYQN